MNKGKNNLPKKEKRFKLITTYLVFVKALKEKALSVKEEA
jgi:hypothetical protein